MDDNDKDNKNSIEKEIDSNVEEIREIINKYDGDEQIRIYYKGELLGEGGYSKCYKLICPEKNKSFAAKIIEKSNLTKSNEIDRVLNEIRIHKSLRHSHIVVFEHYFEDEDNIYILLELCTNKTMYELIKRRKYLNEIEIRYYMIQLIKALRYLHSHMVIHRDLKLANLFLSEKMELKLGDFGLSSKLMKNEEKKYTVCGTSNYMAPEILNEKEGYSYKVDIWSLGVIIYILIIGKPPFDDKDSLSIYKRIKKNDYFFPKDIRISEELKDLIKKILVLDQEKRPTLEEILAHDFFNNKISIPNSLSSLDLLFEPNINKINKFMQQVEEEGLIHKSINKNKIKKTENFPLEKSDETQNIVKNWNLEEDIIIPYPDIMVKEWYYSRNDKCLIYFLSDRNYGALFKDNSKILSVPSKNKFFYIENPYYDQPPIIIKYENEDYPINVKDKIKLFNDLKKNLKITDKFEKDNENINNKKNKEKNKGNKSSIIEYFYVKDWEETKSAIIFLFKGGIIQAIFKDKTEIYISTKKNFVTYIDENKEMKNYPLKTVLSYPNFDMVIKVSYIVDIAKTILFMNIQTGNKRKKNNI